MVDEIFDRGYQAARGNLNTGLADAYATIADTIGEGLKALHRFEWNAPWAAQKKKTRRA